VSNSRKSSGRLAAWWVGLGILAAAALAAGAAPAQPQPRSCKPSPPLRLTLEPGSTAATWRLRLEAQAPAADVTVTLRTDAATPRLVWRGAVAAGETRMFDVRHPVSADATVLQAVAEIAAPANVVLRGVASVALAGGKPVTAARAAGRLVVNPQSGEPVLELPGTTGGRR
jgi:hypothetical protein